VNKYLNTVDYILWTSGLLLEFLILAAAICHKHWNRYPAFVSYIGYSAIQTMSLMYLVASHADYVVYWLGYWITTIIRVGMLTGVGIEIFSIIFKPLDTIPAGRIRRLFLLVLLFIVMMVAAAIFFPVGLHDPLQKFFKTLDRTATAIVTFAVGIVIFESERIGIPKTMKLYGISAGILLTLCVDFVIASVSWIVPTSYMEQYLRFISMLAFTISGIIWFFYFSKPEPNVIPPTREQLEVLLKLATSWQITDKKEIHS
jgi:hypothetical protein